MQIEETERIKNKIMGKREKEREREIKGKRDSERERER